MLFHPEGIDFVFHPSTVVPTYGAGGAGAKDAKEKTTLSELKYIGIIKGLRDLGIKIQSNF